MPVRWKRFYKALNNKIIDIISRVALFYLERQIKNFFPHNIFEVVWHSDGRNSREMPPVLHYFIPSRRLHTDNQTFVHACIDFTSTVYKEKFTSVMWLNALNMESEMSLSRWKSRFRLLGGGQWAKNESSNKLLRVSGENIGSFFQMTPKICIYESSHGEECDFLSFSDSGSSLN